MHRYSLLERILYGRVRLDKRKLGNALRQKTVLITGASSGIGEQLALLLGEIDLHLIVVARREERLLALKEQLEQRVARVSIIPADLRRAADMGRVLGFLGQLEGGVDLVVNNAGLSIRRPLPQSLDRYHDFTRTMAINYFAPVQLLLATIPSLAQNKGQIINVSTINNALIPLPYWAAYQASKAAFDTWQRSAAPELAAMGIVATAVYLPLVRTPMIAPTAAYARAPAMSAEHAASLVARACYTRRTTVRPWWLLPAELASVAFRRNWERIITGRLKQRQRRTGGKE